MLIKQLKLSKQMLVMLISVGILFGAIFSFILFKGYMVKRFLRSGHTPPVSVSTLKVENQSWQFKIKAVGSLQPVLGVDVTTEVAGLVRSIPFTAGSEVKKGDVLVELNSDADVAQLQVFQAAAELAKITYVRDKEQFAINAVSKAVLDADLADLKGKEAQVAEQIAIVAKKKISAPFNGRLGISAIRPGQYVNPGDKIVTLQSLDFLYVEFFLPQQMLVEIAVGQTVSITTDTYPNQTFIGKITTIDPKIDPETRNVQVEATVSNPKHLLLPGMFVLAQVNIGAPKRYLTVPQTAIAYNPYGDLVYIVKEQETSKKGKPVLFVKQIFVNLGETRGDQIAVLQGLREGDIVVTSGQLKLKNGSLVVINNAVQPNNDPAPHPRNE